MAPKSLSKKSRHLWRFLGAGATVAPFGLGTPNPANNLAHWVYFLGQPLSQNRVFQNIWLEPPLKK